MAADPETVDPLAALPDWVPEPARRYIAHTEAGTSIRALARRAGCHASTVLRQIRACEARRDDPLVDAALRRIGRRMPPPVRRHPAQEETGKMDKTVLQDTAALAGGTLLTEACRVLKRLCESGAVLAVAADMEKAVVLRDGPSGQASRTAVVDRSVAEAMALNHWIACQSQGRVSRYRITKSGREAMMTLLDDTPASQDGIATGFRDMRPALGHDRADSHAGDGADRQRRLRYGAAETPLIALARRRDRDGLHFLSPELVRAGERLREDFDLAGLVPLRPGSWDQMMLQMTPAPGHAQGGPGSPDAARLRVLDALRELGPGLGDVALRCCCYLEGLETAEKRMGWSARSGKIVLRIALQRLRRHYDGLHDGGGLIG